MNPLMNRNNLIALFLAVSIAPFQFAHAGAAAPLIVSQMTSSEKGYFGERLVDEFWRSSQRVPLIDKWHPNSSGPDMLFRLPDGTIEVHEVKTFRGWAGHQALRTEVNGRELTQLSDAWLREWGKRVQASPASAQELEAAQIVDDAIRGGRIVRVFDEVNLETGSWRVSNATPLGDEGIQLVERAGPMRIARIESRLAASKAEYALRNASRAVPRPPSVAEAVVGDVLVPLPERGLPVPAVETVVGAVAIPLGALVVAEGISELRDGHTFDGATHVAEGGLVASSGVAFIAGGAGVGIGLGGGAAIVDGVRDVGHGLSSGEHGRTAVGSVKVLAGVMMVAGACSGNPALVVAGTVTYVGVVVGDTAYEAVQTHHANFGTADIRWRDPADCGTGWLSVQAAE